MACAEALLRSSEAHAAPTSKLTYVRGPGAEGCPAEPELRAAVARRVGYDPFFPYAARTVVAQIDHGPNGFRAQIRIVDGAGQLLGERAIAAMSSCGELVQNLALTISVAIDDLDAATAPPEKEPAAQPSEPATDGGSAPEQTELPPRDQPAFPPRESPLHLRTSLGALMSLGSAPSPAVGAVLGAALRGPWWQLGVEGRFDAPASTSLNGGGGDVATMLLLASVAPCVLAPGSVTPYACVVGSLGSFRAESSNVTLPAHSSAAYGSLGARIGLEIALFRRLAGYVQVDGAAPTTRHRLELNGATVFTVPPVWVAFGVGVSVLFF